jgi:hypothetical protein
MTQLTVDVPEEIAERLSRAAAEQNKSVEQLIVEQLAAVSEPAGESLADRYERFIKESGLFRQVSEEEKRRYIPVSEKRLLELAAKLGEAGPLSEVIIADRKRGW